MKAKAIASLIDDKKDTSPVFDNAMDDDKPPKTKKEKFMKYMRGLIPFKYDVNRDLKDFDPIADREGGLDHGDTSGISAPTTHSVTLTDSVNDKIKKYQDEQAAHKKRLQDDEIKAAEEAQKTIFSFVKDRYENELNAIQKNIDANNKAKEKETANIQSSTLSQQEKAAAEINLNAKIDAQK